MLPKKKRLTTKEFSRFFASGRRVHGSLVQLIHAPHEEFHGAAVVGKKVFKSAVKRNKVRRRMYDALYRIHRRDGLCGVYILIAKPIAAQAGFAAIAEDVERVLARTRT